MEGERNAETVEYERDVGGIENQYSPGARGGGGVRVSNGGVQVAKRGAVPQKIKWLWVLRTTDMTYLLPT